MHILAQKFGNPSNFAEINIQELIKHLGLECHAHIRKKFTSATQLKVHMKLLDLKKRYQDGQFDLAEFGKAFNYEFTTK